MKNAMIRLTSLIFLLATLTLGGTSAVAQEAIGLILSASGTVTAEDQSGNSRRLTRRSPVYEGDTINTAARSRAQIRFNDNGLVALQPDTSFFVEEHQFQGQEDGTESATYRLVRGGLQSITGLIGNTNKENYRVETPVATIGLRGTHWAATMCTTTCAGNPPGLYGGVADGGIDVCNGGGCAAVETDSYFYAADANTQPQLLLAPPNVVFTDSATSDEEGDEAEEGDGSEDGANEGDDAESEQASDGDGETAENAPATRAPEDTSSFVASRVDDVDSDSDLAREFGNAGELGTVEPVVSEAADRIARDTDEILDEIGDDVDGGDPVDPGDDLDPRVVSNPIIVLAQGGTVATFASGFNEDGSPMAVNTVVIPGNGDDRIGLTTLADIGTTVTALDFFDPEGIDCQPCLFALAPDTDQSAELQEFFNGTLGGANYSIGRWLGDAVISDTGELLDSLQNHHFAFSDGLSSALPSFELPTIAHYSLEDATLPTAGSGVTGTLNTATLDIDFYQQLITDFDMAMTFGSRQVTSSLLEPVSLAHPSRLVVAARDIQLAGLCAGGSCGSQLALEGSSSLAFIGSNAQGILGSFSLNELQGTNQSFAGAFVLGRDSTEVHPNYYSGTPAGMAVPTGAVGAFAAQIFESGVDDEGPGGISFAAFSNSELDIQQSFTSTTIDGIENVLTGFHYEPGEYDNHGSPEDPELIWELAVVNIEDAFLIENGSTTLGGSVPANWGIWLSPAGEELTSSEGTELIGPYLHYAYAESVTPDTYASNPLLQLAHYSLAGGTSPTDLNDRLGTLNSVSLTLDYFQQAITEFDLSATIASANYVASLYGIEYLDGQWQDLELDLFGSCSGGDCGEGEELKGDSSLSFVGAGADGVLGHFSLANEDATLGAYGVYALEESELITPHPFVVDAPLSTTDASSGAGVFATSSDGGVYAGAMVPGLEVSDGSTTSTERIGLATLGGVSNIVADFSSGESYPYCNDGCSSEPYIFDFQIEEGILAEQGGFIDFAGTGFGINWGRWDALASGNRTEAGSVYPVDLYDQHHFGYYDGPVDITPTRSDFTNPSVVNYSWAGGTSPTNEHGEFGVVDHFDLTLDFFAQSVRSVDLALSIGNREYEARMPRRFDFYSDLLGVYTSGRGLNFELIDYIGFIPLVGQCEGGDCGYFDQTDSNGNSVGGTYLAGELELTMLGNNGEGLLGSYALSGLDSDPELASCGILYECAYLVVSEPDPYDITAVGVAALEGDSPINHPLWVTDFSDTAASAGSGAVLAVTKEVSTNEFHPIGELRDDSSFDLMNLFTFDGIVSSVNSASGCTLCGVEFSDAVLIEYGSTVHPSSYIDGPEINWGTWESRAPGWLATDAGPVTSGDFFQFVYADNLTASMPSSPVTSFDDSYVYYNFAGGTAPVSESGQLGYVDYMYMTLDFDYQQISDFSATYVFPREDGYDLEYYFNLYSPHYIGSSTSTQFTLEGTCYECGVDSTYVDLSAEADVHLAFAGLQAESAIGSLVGWTLDDGETYTDGYYSIQHAFVMHQQFDDHWVIEPEVEAATGGAVAAATLTDDLYVFSGFSFSGVVGENGVTADLTNVIASDHDHPNSVASFTTSDASWAPTNCSGGCSWSLSEGQVQWYDNNLNDSGRDYDVYWGRWMHQDELDDNGSGNVTNGYTQFAYSPDVTEFVPTSGSLDYALAGNPDPADSYSNEGSISSVYMSIDFLTQQVTSFDLIAYASGNTYDVSELAPAGLSGPSAVVDLIGTCDGTPCGTSAPATGTANVTLIGPNAEGALGAFSVSDYTQLNSLSGTFVLDSLVP